MMQTRISKNHNNTSCFYIQIFKAQASLYSWAGWFESYGVAHPGDISRDVAHMENKNIMTKAWIKWTYTADKLGWNSLVRKERKKQIQIFVFNL